MKGINVLVADQLKHWDVKISTAKGYKLARPYGQTGLLRRIKLAWLVFTGEADVLKWYNQ